MLKNTEQMLTIKNKVEYVDRSVEREKRFIRFDRLEQTMAQVLKELQEIKQLLSNYPQTQYVQQELKKKEAVKKKVVASIDEEFIPNVDLNGINMKTKENKQVAETNIGSLVDTLKETKE